VSFSNSNAHVKAVKIFKILIIAVKKDSSLKLILQRFNKIPKEVPNKDLNKKLYKN
jgi:hypothetical protein